MVFSLYDLVPSGQNDPERKALFYGRHSAISSATKSMGIAIPCQAKSPLLQKEDFTVWFSGTPFPFGLSALALVGIVPDLNDSAGLRIPSCFA